MEEDLRAEAGPRDWLEHMTSDLEASSTGGDNHSAIAITIAPVSS